MILFLDFDGVLHPVNRTTGVFACLAYFESVIQDFLTVDIVISSAWRESHSLEKLQSFFSTNIRHRIIDVTSILPSLSHQYIRQAEIMFWLREAGREYEEWIAIDDSDWLFLPACRNLILVDADIGFNSAAEKKLRAKLSGY